MESLLMLVGEHHFTADLVPRIQHHLAAVEIITVATRDEADDVFTNYSPSALILQAYYPLSQELCQYLKQTRDLAWIYCLVVDLQDTLKSDHREQRTVATIEVLNMGADAYLSLAPISPQQPEPSISEQQLLYAQLMVTMRHVKLYQDLTRANNLLSAIALSDALTQINNRRAFDWELPRQIKAAQEKCLDLSLMMIDIDHFKGINDTYGHLVGDKALKLLADRLLYNMRAYDTPYRYGGEEFVVMLSHTNLEEAKAIGHRVKQLISGDPFVMDETLKLKLTVSIGIASLTPADDSKGLSLLNRADQGLLAAKSSGRNQVRFAD